MQGIDLLKKEIILFPVHCPQHWMLVVNMHACITPIRFYYFFRLFLYNRSMFAVSIHYSIALISLLIMLTGYGMQLFMHACIFVQYHYSHIHTGTFLPGNVVLTVGNGNFVTWFVM